ncbi:MAG: hypothetical protein QXD48_00430 [Candidatus Aenigmatarchaeota archaeon]
METQYGKIFVCMTCSKEILILKEGKSLNPPLCCGKVMRIRK